MARDNSSRKSSARKDQFMTTIMRNYQDILSTLKKNNVSDRLKKYEERMISFESQIQSLQLNMSQNYR